MLIRLFAALVLLSSPVLRLQPPVVAAEIAVQGFPISAMMRATALDQVFTQFGTAIAEVARNEDIAANRTFLKHWDATARAMFDADAMHRRLALTLEGKFSADEQAVLGTFFRSELGRRVTGLERDAALLPPAGQLSAITLGEAIDAAADAVRSKQLDALLTLVSAEISADMLGQSLRAVLLGLSISHQHGDIDVPWSEIDAQVDAMLPELTTSVQHTQRDLMAYAYRNLTDAELDRYIAFLGTAPAQKFYALATRAIGRIVTDTMSAFGDAFASRMASVDI